MYTSHVIVHVHHMSLYMYSTMYSIVSHTCQGLIQTYVLEGAKLIIVETWGGGGAHLVYM